MLLAVALAQASVLRHAVIVGANLGGGSLEPLRYAETDAQKVADTLVELGGFDPAYVTVLYSPTQGALKEALHDHADIARTSGDDLFLFYYSGHADARGLRLNSEMYGFEALRGDIRMMQSEVKLGILDACRSGTITRLKGAALTQPFLYQDRLAAEGEAWMTAASADEEAQESDQLRGSFFTHYLLSGLRGAADSGDGDVSLDEAYRYAYDRVVDRTGGTVNGAQHPNYDYRINGEGQLPLTHLTQGRSTATLPPELDGAITVLRLPDRTPVAEVTKKYGQPITLALAPGSYKLRLVQGQVLKETEIMLSDGARMTVTRWGSSSAEAGARKGVVQDARELARLGAQEGRSYFKKALNAEDLRHSPLLGGGISAVLPGGGQFYNGQWVKGSAYLIATGSLLAVTVFRPEGSFFNGSITGPDPLVLTTAMLYGAAMADASYNANRFEPMRPKTGFALSTASAWNPNYGFESPWVAGLNAEWIIVPNVSIGLDRVGWTRDEQGHDRWNVGSRAQLSIEWPRVRPGIFANFAVRYFGAQREVVPVIGGGLTFRYYISPRYFIEWEGRGESEGGQPRFTAGGGLGIHLGG